MHPAIKSFGILVTICAVGVGAGLLAAKSYRALAATPGYTQGDYSSKFEQTGQSVVLLGASWCGYCAKTREHLESRGVSFAALDVDSSVQAQQWMLELGASGVPVLLIGDRQIRGFRPQEIDSALASIDM